jgi:two-component system chemotaxis response regulator CheY
MKILIVDDSMAARMLMKGFFSDDSSFEILEAENGQRAVDIYKSERPDITFLDLTMPVMDGFEALRLIRETDPGAIVIILTADIQKKSIEKAMGLGAYTVIKKLPAKENIIEIISKIKQ